MIRSLRNRANGFRSEPSVGGYPWKLARRLLVRSVTTSTPCPCPCRACQTDASLARSSLGEATNISPRSWPRSAPAPASSGLAASGGRDGVASILKRRRLQPAPAEDVPVDDVERLTSASLGGRGPFHVIRQDVDVGSK